MSRGWQLIVWGNKRRKMAVTGARRQITLTEQPKVADLNFLGNKKPVIFEFYANPHF